MKFLISISIISSLSFLQLSCSFCNRVDCSGVTGDIEIRLMRNGQNALFGPDAFIHRNSIRYFITDPLERDYLIGFVEGTQSMSLYLIEGREHILEISNIRTDTLVSNMELTGMGECCPIYEFTSVTRNGQNICDLNCGEVIDIEI